MVLTTLSKTPYTLGDDLEIPISLWDSLLDKSWHGLPFPVFLPKVHSVSPLPAFVFRTDDCLYIFSITFGSLVVDSTSSHFVSVIVVETQRYDLIQSAVYRIPNERLAGILDSFDSLHRDLLRYWNTNNRKKSDFLFILSRPDFLILDDYIHPVEYADKFVPTQQNFFMRDFRKIRKFFPEVARIQSVHKAREYHSLLFVNQSGKFFVSCTWYHITKSNQTKYRMCISLHVDGETFYYYLNMSPDVYMEVIDFSMRYKPATVKVKLDFVPR